jgi:stearoyl-CoA desaturase (delta-9 desaturase)
MQSQREKHPPICWSSPTTWVLLGIPVVALVGVTLWLFGQLKVPAGIGWSMVTQYGIQMFLIAAFFHRQLAHPTYDFRFKRPSQFVLSALTTTALQGGPIWWVAIHRQHHRSDIDQKVKDPHSDKLGFWWCHMGWLLAGDTTPNLEYVKDLTKYREMRLVDRFHYIPPILLGLAWFLTYGIVGVFAFVVTTFVVQNCTWFINSLAHLYNYKPGKGCWPMIPFSFGEWTHKWHHLNPMRLWQGGRWFQRLWDPAAWGVYLMRSLGLVTKIRA